MDSKTPDLPSQPQPALRAADAQKAAGVSYRQLNDWDSKGAVPGERKPGRKWRRFTAREFFALMVCGALRKQFSVPIDQLRYVRILMTQEGSDHLVVAIRLMRLGLAVWLMTDCKSTFIMDNDLEFADLFQHGAFRGKNMDGYMLLRIDPVVRQTVAALKAPIDLTPTTDTYAQVAAALGAVWENAFSAQEILKLVRDPTNEAVNLNVKDGAIVRATTKKRPLGAPDREVTEADVLRMLRSDRFQTVVLKKHDGKIVHVERSIPIPMEKSAPRGRKATTARKPSDRRGKSRGRQAT